MTLPWLQGCSGAYRDKLYRRTIGVDIVKQYFCVPIVKQGHGSNFERNAT